MVKGSTIVAAVLLILQPALAQVSVEQGLGTATCAQFASFYRLDPRSEDQFISWAHGFMTGWNIGARELGGVNRNLSATSLEGQKLFIRQHCDRFPLQTYIQAVTALYLELPALPPKQ